MVDILKAIAIFSCVQLISVIIGTCKTIITVKGNEISAAAISALNSGFYTYVIVMTATADFSSNAKALITAAVNFVGVFFVKFLEKKLKKDQLWVYTATINKESSVVKSVIKLLKNSNVKLLYNKVAEDLYSLQVFSYTKEESTMIKSIFENYKIKYFITESKKIKTAKKSGN